MKKKQTNEPKQNKKTVDRFEVRETLYVCTAGFLRWRVLSSVLARPALEPHPWRANFLDRILQKSYLAAGYLFSQYQDSQFSQRTSW